MTSRRSKTTQKNVSVYMGRRGAWQHDLLAVVCRYLGITESEFFRELFVKQMRRWDLVDDGGQPNGEKIDALRARARPSGLPDDL